MGSISGEVVSYSHRFSPYAQRVTIALKEKGIQNKQVIVDFMNKPQGLLDANPVWGKIPTIVHDGNAIAESMVILEYLDEGFPDTVALLPKDPLERAKVRFWGDYVFKGVDNLVNILRAKPGSPEKQASIDAAPKFFKTVDEAITGYSKDGPFFTGEKFGLLDVLLGPIVSVFLLAKEIMGITIPGPEEIPRFHKWAKAVSQHKSVSDTLPSAEETLQFFQTMAKKRAEREAAAAKKQ